MEKHFLTSTAVRCFLEILAYSSLQKFPKSFRFIGCCFAIGSFSSSHRFSIGLWSGDWLHDLNLLLFNHFLVALVVFIGSLSCWKTVDPIWMFWWREGGSCPRFYGTWPHLFALDAVNLFCTLSRKTDPNHNASTYMIDGGDDVLWVILSVSPPTRQSITT